MSATYTAWNGQPYPWPPPEGWYEAADGRWWAPGYGPDDVGDQETVLNDRPAAADAGATAPDALLASTANAASQAIETASAETDRTEAEKRSRAPLVAAGAMVAVLLAAGLGFLAVRDDSTSAALATTTTTLVEQTSPTTAHVLTPTTLGEPASATTFVESTTTTTQPSETETTVAPQSTAPSSSAPPTTLPATSAATFASIVVPAGPFATDGERAAAWRDVLDQGGIDSGALTDADVIGFGNDFCLFVTVSEDLAEFDEFRNRALSAIVGELTELELGFAINTAVLVFCPEGAERVGVSL